MHSINMTNLKAFICLMEVQWGGTIHNLDTLNTLSRGGISTSNCKGTDFCHVIIVWQ